MTTDEQARFEILLEDIRGSVKAIAEGHGALVEGQKGLERRFDALEGRFDVLEGRFDVLEGRFDTLEGRFDVLEGRFDTLESKVDVLADDTGKRLQRIEHHLGLNGAAKRAVASKRPKKK